MFKKIILAAGTTVALLAALEIGFRIYDYGFRYQRLEKAVREKRDLSLPFEEINGWLFKTGRCLRDPDLLWRYAPGANSPEFCPLGIRTKDGREPAVVKPADSYRIIILGGSHPFGLCLPYAKTYACVLEEMLRRADLFQGRKVEVINAAVPGYSSLQSLNFLKKRLLNYSPDLLIVDSGNNDGIKLTSGYSVSDRRAIDGNRRFFPLLVLLDRSSFCWYLRSAFAGRVKKIASGEVEAGTRVSIEENLENLREMRKIAGENGIAIVFVGQVSWDGKELCRGFGARVEPYLDLYERLKEREDLAEYFIDQVHGSEKGHREIAALIYEHLAMNTGKGR